MDIIEKIKALRELDVQTIQFDSTGNIVLVVFVPKPQNAAAYVPAVMQPFVEQRRESAIDLALNPPNDVRFPGEGSND